MQELPTAVNSDAPDISICPMVTLEEPEFRMVSICVDPALPVGRAPKFILFTVDDSFAVPATVAVNATDRGEPGASLVIVSVADLGPTELAVEPGTKVIGI